MSTRKVLHEYWKNPEKENSPRKYIGSPNGIKRSNYLAGLVREHAPKNSSILEPGCNVGRNLNVLWGAGYKDLSGLEINQRASVLMLKTFPHMAARIYQGPIELTVDSLPVFDLVFTMAFLVHLHTDSEWVFEKLANCAGKTIITVEDETSKGSRHFSRNYEDVFSQFRFEQLQVETNIPGLNTHYFARVFKRI